MPISSDPDEVGAKLGFITKIEGSEDGSDPFLDHEWWSVTQKLVVMIPGTDLYSYDSNP